MFGNIGWGEFMVLLIAALVILGPERLPGAVSWVTKSLRQVREYASGASQQLKDELGPEFDDLRKPLADLNQLRGMTPRAVITKHLLDGDDSVISGTFDGKPFANGSPNNSSIPKSVPSSPPLAANERPPVDPDAT
ncbi:Sec-independent protein translocase subunit TatB [Rhodococcus sp. ABRD24]|uniref:Sec-independent protein translocase protein TatB n=1 Tax=Rhodococcus sp. ABRD24 TaxID=2507582 RepID=UPI00103F5FB2|nr:Sec-independent protein translocase protein TatB [Rhodococcus sp. ABRD24]QBJ97793.1 Sec-independent protein translocase subunit TatB [Rhodococcus sp. ABRD24]